MLLVTIGLLFGIRYIFSSQLMPYHLRAMGVATWDNVISQYKLMVLTFMKVAGLGMLSVSVGISILILNPLKNNKMWSRLSVFILFCVHYIPLTVFISILKFNTKASPPLGLNIIALCVAFIAFLLTKNRGKLSAQFSQ